MLNLHFMMMPTRHQFSAFAPENTPLLRENQYNYLRFNFLNPPVHYPRTHDSNIPEFQHSNCERSELTWTGLQDYFGLVYLYPVHPVNPVRKIKLHFI